MKYIFIICILCGQALGIQSQTCCSGGAPISSSLSSDIHGKSTGATIQVMHEYTSVNRLVFENKRLKNDPRTRYGQFTFLKMDYIHTQHWSFGLMIPFISQHRETFSETSQINNFGDLNLMLRYTDQFADLNYWSLTAILKLPTGLHNALNDNGLVASPDMQSGSGTFDYSIQFSLLNNQIFLPNLNHQLSVLYRYNTTNKHAGRLGGNTGGRIFKFGNEFMMTSTWNYLFLIGRWFMMPQIGLQFRHTLPNEEQYTQASNSGGRWLNLTTGIMASPTSDYSFGLIGNLPLAQHLQGLQITTSFAIRAVLRYNISFHNTQI